jgi:hypothetical protein
MRRSIQKAGVPFSVNRDFRKSVILRYRAFDIFPAVYTGEDLLKSVDGVIIA